MLPPQNRVLTPWPVSARPLVGPQTPLCTLPSPPPHLPLPPPNSRYGLKPAGTPRPAQFKAKFSIKPSPVPTSLPSPCPNLEATGAQGTYLSIHCALGCTPSACRTPSTVVITAVVTIVNIWLRARLRTRKRAEHLPCINSFNSRVNPMGSMLFLSSVSKWED